MFNLTSLNAATNDYSDNRVNDIFFRENILLYRLMGNGGDILNLVKAKDMVDGGTRIREHLEYAKSNGGTYGNSSNIDTSAKDVTNAARFAKSGYVSSNTITLDEQVENEGKAAMIDLVYVKQKSIEKTIRDFMGTGIYTARADSPDSYGFDGLPDLFNTDTAVAYGEITEDDVPTWKANVDTAAEALTYKVMQKLIRAGRVGGSKEGVANQIISTDELVDTYKVLLQTQQRFMHQNDSLANAGFQNILHEGIPMVADDKQADGVVDCLNLRFMKLRAFTSYNFTKAKWEYDLRTPDTLTSNVRFIGALTCTHRGAQSRGTGKTAA